jgi:aldehyde:ferredoxin oxidoreductase
MKDILVVDLTSRSSRTLPIDPETAREYVGGSGLAARLLYDQLNNELDPLRPENPLLYLTGPLVGTSMPSAGRCTVSALSPLTGIWGESNTGGFIGPELRFSGYDGLLVTGRASSPCWISLIDGELLFHEAEKLWGQDSYQTQESIRGLLGDPQARISCIGTAGENLVKMASIMNDHGRAAGRTGLGAVMGSKNLKAIAFRGSKKVELANPGTFKQVVAEILKQLKDDLAVQALRMAGTAGYVDMGLMFGDVPISYYQLGEWEPAGKLSGVLLAEEHLNRNMACFRCPIVCGRETSTVKYRVDRVDGPEYETIAAFGSLSLVDNLEGVIYAGHLCNLFGLDTISTGSTIALANVMFEKGILTEEDTGGLQIRSGDIEMAHRLIEMIARREGFGALLAEGSASLAAHFHVPEMAATVRKLEIPMHDPRAFSGMAPVYALSPRGACHLQGDMYGVDTGQGPPAELDILPGDRLESSLAKGHITARAQAWRSIYNALIVCHFMNPGASRIVEALNAATGWDYSLEDLYQSGRRIFTLKRIINDNLGSGPSADRLPGFLQKPLQEGGTMGNVPDLQTLLSGAYAEHGWSLETGMPTPATISDLDLGFTGRGN